MIFWAILNHPFSTRLLPLSATSSLETIGRVGVISLATIRVATIRVGSYHERGDDCCGCHAISVATTPTYRKEGSFVNPEKMDLLFPP